jgi:hypothetical protein
MLMMQSAQLTRTSSFKFKLKLTNEEVLEMREGIRKNLHKIQFILRTVVISMVLTLRYFCIKSEQSRTRDVFLGN